jgi:hypothetical protein
LPFVTGGTKPDAPAPTGLHPGNCRFVRETDGITEPANVAKLEVAGPGSTAFVDQALR